MNSYGRISCCGAICAYNSTEKVKGEYLIDSQLTINLVVKVATNTNSNRLSQFLVQLSQRTTFVPQAYLEPGSYLGNGKFASKVS